MPASWEVLSPRFWGAAASLFSLLYPRGRWLSPEVLETALNVVLQAGQ